MVTRLNAVAATALLSLLVGCSTNADDETTTAPGPASIKEPQADKPLTSPGPSEEATSSTHDDTPILAADGELPSAQLREVRAFLRFASEPSQTTAREVDFAPGRVLVALRADVQHRLHPAALVDEERWNVLDEEAGGTTSALFVLSNALAQSTPHGQTPPLVVSSRARHLCGQRVLVPPALRGLSLVSVVRTSPVRSCLQAFRVDFFFDGGSIAGVGLDLWAP